MSKDVKIGNRLIGGGNPILIQYMLNVKTSKIKEVIEQIESIQ